MGTSWELQYQDVFDRPHPGPDWEATDGEFEVLRDASTGRGVLHGKGEIMLLRRFRGDVRVEMQASSAQPCDLSVTLGTSDAGWYNGYFLGFGSAGNTASKILRKEKQVALSADKIVPGASHTIVAEKSGSLVTMTVDGREILRFEDEEPLYGPKHEMIGLYLHNLSTVDFVKVYGRQGETPVKLTELPKAATPHMFRGEDMGWKDHNIRVGDGKGGFSYKKGEFQFLLATGFSIMPFGLAQMDNGEVILVAAASEEGTKRKSLPVVASSKDGGGTWSDWQRIPDETGRPMMLADLGGGRLTFQLDRFRSRRYYSSDHGRTWPERVSVPPAKGGQFWETEGNPLVERDADGKVVLAEIGYGSLDGYPAGPVVGHIRWSRDGGQTWTEQSSPREWLWEDAFEGKTYVRGTSEGSLVRAKNGWLVAGLRTDLPARWIPSRNDNYEGTGVSISKDNGKTWTPINIIHRVGRMHMHFVKMPNGDLAMIYVMRQDMAPDGMRHRSYRRGCAALVSRDNGLTWDVSREYMLHEFDFATGANVNHNGIGALACGHSCSTLLDDGSILTAYTHYISNGIAMIRWKPGEVAGPFGG